MNGPTPNRRARRSQRRRRRPAVVGFTALLIGCVVAGFAYLRFVGSSSDEQRDTVLVAIAPPGSEARFRHESHLLFRNNGRGHEYGAVAITPMSRPGGPRVVTNLRCERVSFANGRGMCLTDEAGIVMTSGLDVFDADFRVLHHVALPGIASRARVAPNGRVGASTVFVSGDSYASDSFSTRTNFFDLEKGRIIGDLGKFRVTKSGRRVDSVDRNYWGVTFASDSNTFYATLGTRGHRYLIRGDLARRRGVVIHDDIECPSVSPDGTRIAFKRRERGGVFGGVEAGAKWQLRVLDLRSGREVALAEPRGVDDQPMWFDDHEIGYAIPRNAVGISANNIYKVPADGSGAPRLVVASGWSPTLVP